MFESLLSWLLKALTSALDGMLDTFTYEQYELSLERFVQYFPIAGTLYATIRGIALGLVIGIAIINLLKFFLAPLGRVSENPTILMFRTFMAVGFVYFGGHILEFMIEIFKGPYSAILGTEETYSGWFANFGESVARGSGIPGIGDMTIGAKNIICLFAIVALGINILKFILEFVERWIMVGVLAYTGPLGWCTLASSSTMGIFQKWINMFFSQCFMMLISAWSIKMMFSIMGNSTVPDTQLLYRIIAALAFCRVAQRFDSYVQQLGLNATTTGGSLLDEVIGTAKTASAMVNKASGRGGHGGGNGDDSATVLGATGAKGSYGSAMFVGGAAGVFGVAGARAARGVAKGFAAARSEGASIKDSIKQGVKQAGHNVVDGIAPEHNATTAAGVAFNAVRGKWGSAANSIESRVRHAMAEQDAGNSTAFDNLTTAEKNLANKYREEDPKDLPVTEPIGGFENPTSDDSFALSESAEREGFFTASANGFDDTEDFSDTYVGSEKGENYTAAFAEKNLAPQKVSIGADGKQQIEEIKLGSASFNTVNSSVRHLSNSDYAMDMKIPERLASEESTRSRFAGGTTTKRDQQVWASTVMSSGVGTSESYKAMAEKQSGGTFSRLQKSMEKMSYGVDDGNISFDTNLSQSPSWRKDAASSGHETSFVFKDGQSASYQVTIMDQKQFDQYKKMGQMSKEQVQTMHSFTDRSGNARYISMTVQDSNN